jgi:hypothetical protein
MADTSLPFYAILYSADSSLEYPCNGSHLFFIFLLIVDFLLLLDAGGLVFEGKAILVLAGLLLTACFAELVMWKMEILVSGKKKMHSPNNLLKAHIFFLQ